MIRRLSIAMALCAGMLLSASFASATTEVMNFDLLKDGQQVLNFYDGGSGNPNIPNFGVTFSSNFYALHSQVQGGSGNFSPTPSSSPAVFISGTLGSTVTGTMNVNNGFSTGINFFYTAAFQETVKVWSGANGTGTVLATITLAGNDANCSTPSYCNWTDVGVGLSGVAKSVTFSGPANELGIADITLGQTTTAAVPEPSSLYLLGTGLLGFCAQNMRRFIRG